MPPLPLPRFPSLANALLGRHPRRRRHVLFVLATGPLYAVSMAVAIQSSAFGLLPPFLALILAGTSLAVFTLVYALVRSGWSARLSDPVLTFPHAMACIVLSMAAYVALGSDRGNVIILIAQTIVAAMFRLRPLQVLALGCASVLLLAASVTGLHHHDPVGFPAPVGWLHLSVGGSTILLLSLVAKWVSDIRVRLDRQARELKDALTTVQQLATTDMLTGLMNRRMMAEVLEREIRQSQRHDTPMCVALIDIDHFKQVNDRHGHAAGDEVLKALAALGRKDLRQVDLLARWGGEEFLLLLPRVPLTDALVALDRLRLQAQQLAVPGNPAVRISVSAGVAQLHEDETLDALLDRADAALYEAKRTGRNRCVAAGPSMGEPAAAAEGSALLIDLRSVARLQEDGA